IGCALILGFKLPENFQMPYSAVTITEFWRRWHITLSSWLRDYIFLPLEMATRGNPNRTLRASINVIITFLLCGLWHGASWTFVIWGGVHGASLAVHRAWAVWNPLASLTNHRGFQFAWPLFSRLLTLGTVLLAWVFFRAQSLADAVCYLGRIFAWKH